MTAADALAGLRIAAADTVEAGTVGVLRAAGAVIVDAVAPTRSGRPVADGHADVTVTLAAPAVAVSVTPTPAALPGAVSVVAASLALADRVVTVLAANPPARRWPADVRLAAPPAPVVGCSRAVAGAVTPALSAGGAHVVAVDTDHAGAIPDGLDAMITPAGHALGGTRCAVTVDLNGAALTVSARAFEDAVAMDVAALLTEGQARQHVWPLDAADPVELVVFGAHLRGGPLVHQLTDLGSRWAGEINTVPRYRMTVLPTVPAKPAITRAPDGVAGAALYGHRWLMSAAALGRFLAALPAPMQLGKVEFEDGSWRTAFGCDAAAATGSDISAYGSWPDAVAAGAVLSAGHP